jgi:hypothetical protein
METLSSKIFKEKEWIGAGGGIATGDVKKFIRILKSEVNSKRTHRIIDALAGSELIDG